MQKQNKSNLPKELKSLVGYSLDLLGAAVKNTFGQSVFEQTEYIRSRYKDIRLAGDSKKIETHREIFEYFAGQKANQRFELAHIFAVSLELINTCENTHRAYRLRDKPNINTKINRDTPIIFVLTAHPTESRSASAIKIINQVSSILSVKLQKGSLSPDLERELQHLMVLLLRTPISKTKAPTVLDEAEYIYSTLLKPENIRMLCNYSRMGQPVFIRTWVGGDKDGHPGVNEKAMLGSLTLSRKKILANIKLSLQKCREQTKLIGDDSRPWLTLRRKLQSISAHIPNLSKVEGGDSTRLKRFRKTVENTADLYLHHVGTQSPELDHILTLFNVFPGLVVPLELREDSGLIKDALTLKDAPIAKMIKALRIASKGGNPSWYVRGLVISMCESATDISNALKLLKKHLKNYDIPIVPLFETRIALESSTQIISEALTASDFKNALLKSWDKKLEVMLGYSDSAKESGALFSRAVIHKTLNELDLFITQQGYTPIFFHGSGGSVARGGGSLKEQISWWPKSAQSRFKATIQGEMIHRTFSSEEIFIQKIDRITSAISTPKADRAAPELLQAIKSFSEKTREKYQEMITDTRFMNMVSLATPYPYLDQLKIGSRPSKRTSEINLKSLRAIPWVLCWTQTRALFPVWWGIGTSWRESSREEKEKLIRSFKESSLFSSFVRLLSYTISKVDLSVWGFYLESSELSKQDKLFYLKAFEDELSKTKDFLKEISNETEALWFLPWLEESIKLRSTMIYPLNVLEIIALKENDIPLLRETVTGVASGMLTTG